MYQKGIKKKKKSYDITVEIGGRKIKIRESSLNNRERKMMVQFLKLKKKFKKNKFGTTLSFKSNPYVIV